MAKLKMFFFVFILTSSHVALINTFPQTGPNPGCVEGERWVEFEKCNVDVGETATNITVRASDILGSEVEDKICCLEKNIITKFEVEPSEKICSDFEGFQCISPERCSNVVLAERNALEDVLKVVVNANVRQFQINPAESKCQSDLEVCCSVKDLKPEATTATPVTPTPNEVPTKQSLYAPKCGRHNKNGASNIRFTNSIEGETATQFGEWPHMCLIFKVKSNSAKRGEQNTFLGGASLIAPGVVLTAAHKVFGLNHSEISVRCGEWDLLSRKEPLLHQDRAVRKITIHPAFSNTPATLNNFALLHLIDEFELAKHIDTICLPEDPEELAELAYDSSDCTATGWGKDQHGEIGQFQTNLKQVHLPVVDRKICQAKLRQSGRVQDNFMLDSSLICAGGEKGKDTCDGDGGGPLVCRAKVLDEGKEERFIQVGIVSWGIECGTAEIPGVYASVANGLCFIDWETKCENGDKYNDFYNIKGCQNWIDNELAGLERRKRLYEKRDLAKLTEGQKKLTLQSLEEVTRYIANAKTLKTSCSSSGEQTLDISKIGPRKPELAIRTVDIS